MREFHYQFSTDDGVFEHYHAIDSDAELVEQAGDYPDWTRLEFYQCEGCRFQGQYCPVAVRLEKPAQLLGKIKSYEKVEVSVSSTDRNYHKVTTAQEALSSLLGLIMASSGCPAFEKLRGLAWFHLPFATFEETLFRVVSAYFVQQWLAQEEIKAPAALRDVRVMYEVVGKVNQGITQRLRHGVAAQSDSPMNALVILDSFGALVPLSFEDKLEELRQIFVTPGAR